MYIYICIYMWVRVNPCVVRVYVFVHVCLWFRVRGVYGGAKFS